MRPQRRRILVLALALAALVAVAAVVLLVAGLSGRTARLRPDDGGGVELLAWARDVSAGEEVDLTAVRTVRAPPGVAADARDLAGPRHRKLLARARVVRDVRRGEYVRIGDLLPLGPDGSYAPPGSAPVVIIDPQDLQDLGRGRYASPEQTAVAGRFSDEILPPASTAPAPAGPPPLPTTVPAGEVLREVPDAIVPDGARRLYAFRRTVQGVSADTAAYAVETDAAAAAAFYKTRLSERGYRLAQEGRTARGDGRSLIFLRGRQEYYFVNLRPTDNDTMKVVLVILRRPEGGGSRDGAGG